MNKYPTLRFLYLILVLSFVTSCRAQKGGVNKKAYELVGKALQQRDLLEYDAALETLDKAIKKDPDYVDAWDLKGTINQMLGRNDEATVCFEKVLEFAPEHPYALYNLAELRFAAKRYTDAAKLLQIIITKGPDGPNFAKARLLQDHARFAKDAIKDPVKFQPVNLGPGINTVEEEYFPGLSIDKKTMFFTRRDGRVNIQMQNEDLYTSLWNGQAWGNSKNLGKPINTRENEGAFSASTDGKYLFFTSCSRKGGVGRCDIWMSERQGEGWSVPYNLGRPLNTRDWESQPSLASDGVTIYFVSNRAGGYGGTDIYKSVWNGSNWSEPENLGPKINTPQDEQFPFIHPDGVTLYFSSYGHPGMGKSDIFLSRLENGKWLTPMNLGYPINTEGDEWNFVVDSKGENAYMASDRLDGYGGMDIYTFPLYNEARPKTTSYVKGIVTDKETGEFLYSEVELYDIESGKRIATTHSDSRKGEFLISIPSNRDYAFEVRAKGYLLYSESFALKQSSLLKPMVLKIELEKIKSGRSVVINNVFFDTDKSMLKPESNAELQVLAQFLRDNADVRIEIGGHTDNTGSEERNLELSQNRAKAVYDFLISSGINSSRLSYKGYASSKPIADNDTDEGRAKNRRTEFKVL